MTSLTHRIAGSQLNILVFINGHIFLNSFTTKMQMTKFSFANFQKMLSPSNMILRIQRLEGKQCSSRGRGSYEPPHQDRRCLQMQLFSYLVLKEFCPICRTFSAKITFNFYLCCRPYFLFRRSGIISFAGYL